MSAAHLNIFLLFIVAFWFSISTGAQFSPQAESDQVKSVQDVLTDAKAEIKKSLDNLDEEMTNLEFESGSRE